MSLQSANMKFRGKNSCLSSSNAQGFHAVEKLPKGTKKKRADFVTSVLAPPGKTNIPSREKSAREAADQFPRITVFSEASSTRPFRIQGDYRSFHYHEFHRSRQFRFHILPHPPSQSRPIGLTSPINLHQLALFEPGQTIGPFTITTLIDQGSYGCIYSVRHPDFAQHFAMKLESFTSRRQSLSREFFYLTQLQDCHSFPHLISSGRTSSHNYVVLELLGPSLSSLRRELPSHHFSLSTGLRLSLAMFQAIRSLHIRGIVHCDVKPGNFLIRTTPRDLPIVLIDFGLSKHYFDPSSRRRFPEGGKIGFRGTAKYASVSVHRGHDQSPKDDLIAWLYSTVEIVNGCLPWSRERDVYVMRVRKITIENEKLCQGLPPEFEEIAGYCKALKFETEINYDYVLCLLSRAVRRSCRSLEEPYDWEITQPEKVFAHAVDYGRTIPCMELEIAPDDLLDDEACECAVV